MVDFDSKINRSLSYELYTKFRIQMDRRFASKKFWIRANTYRAKYQPDWESDLQIKIELTIIE